MILHESGHLRWLTAIVIAGFLLITCSQTDQGESGNRTDETQATTAAEPYDSVVIELEGVDSLTVFEILYSNHQIDYLTTAAGVFIKAIDSLENTSDFFWIYSVNDTMPQVASDKYHTSDGDSVRWHYRRIEP